MYENVYSRNFGALRARSLIHAPGLSTGSEPNYSLFLSINYKLYWYTLISLHPPPPLNHTNFDTFQVSRAFAATHLVFPNVFQESSRLASQNVSSQAIFTSAGGSIFNHYNRFFTSGTYSSSHILRRKKLFMGGENRTIVDAIVRVSG